MYLQMSGQKYKRTNFDDDENTSTAGTPPGVTYDPAIAFKVRARARVCGLLYHKMCVCVFVCWTVCLRIVRVRVCVHYRVPQQNCVRVCVWTLQLQGVCVCVCVCVCCF